MFCPQCDFEGSGQTCPQCGARLIPRGSIPDWLMAMRGDVVREDVPPPPPPPPDISEAPIPDWLKEPPAPVEEEAPPEEKTPPAEEPAADWLSTLRSTAVAADAQGETPPPRPSVRAVAPPQYERKPLVGSPDRAVVQPPPSRRGLRPLEIVALVLIVVIALALFCMTAWLMLINLQ